MSGCASMVEPQVTLAYCDLFEEVQSGVIPQEQWSRETGQRFVKAHGSRGSSWLDQQGALSPKERVAHLDATVPRGEMTRCEALRSFMGTFLK